MSSAAVGHDALSDQQLSELLDLLKQVDSVEFKLTVPENDRFSSAEAIGLDPLDAQIRQIYFFDTPDLKLQDQGVVLRARRVQQKADDSVVKLRPVVPGSLPAELRALEEFKVEVDAMPGKFICSGSLKGELGAKDIKATVVGTAKLASLFSTKQQDFYAAHAPSGLGLNDLSVLGPVLVHKYQVPSSGDFARKLDAELWLFPDGVRLLEVSTSCAPPELFDVQAEMRAYLTERGIVLGSQQQTKTSKALAYFSAKLRGENGESGGSPTNDTPPD
jgi:hypothetical protein